MPRLMAGIGRAWYLAQPLVDYRSNPGSILGSMNARKVHDWAQALDDLSRAPGFDRAWADFVAQQAVRMARVGQKLRPNPLPPGAQGTGASNAHHAPGPAWDAELSPWWHRLTARQPLVQEAVRGWAVQPRRWAAWLQARRLGWLQAPVHERPLGHGDP